MRCKLLGNNFEHHLANYSRKQLTQVCIFLYCRQYHTFYLSSLFHLLSWKRQCYWAPAPSDLATWSAPGRVSGPLGTWTWSATARLQRLLLGLHMEVTSGSPEGSCARAFPPFKVLLFSHERCLNPKALKTKKRIYKAPSKEMLLVF